MFELSVPDLYLPFQLFNILADKKTAHHTSIISPTLQTFLSFITARKRSLRRLCFYRCLSFCPQGGACVVARGGGWACKVAHGGACMGAGGGGHAWLLLGGVHGCSQGACVVAPGGACMVAPRGVCMVALGGMRGCFRGACMVTRGHAWLLRGGACMVALGGMHGYSGGGMHGCSPGGMHGCSGGRAWFFR